MSYPIPTVDTFYPDDGFNTINKSAHLMNKKLIVVCSCHQEDESETCLDCDGTGYVSYPAYQSAGEIISGQAYKCACQLK